MATGYSRRVDEGQRWRRGGRADAVLGAAVSVVVATAISMDLGGDRQPDVVAYLFAAGLGALMLVRRQFPVLALVAAATGLLAYYAAGYPAIGLALPRCTRRPRPASWSPPPAPRPRCSW